MKKLHPKCKYQQAIKQKDRHSWIEVATEKATKKREKIRIRYETVVILSLKDLEEI